MLTADLVVARRRGNELRLVTLDEAARLRARELAAGMIAIASEHVGRTRGELEDALGALETEPRDVRLRAGLAKLVDDRCAFEADEGLDPASLRHRLFTAASAARKALAAAERLDRAAVLASFAHDEGLDIETLERALFADLRAAHPLRSFEGTTAELLVEAWERGQAQAVLLRAVKVTVDVRCASPAALRAFFHRLKFLRLLYRVEPKGDGHRLVLDGPFSLFDSVTKYGLQLALVLPALEACDAWELEADVRWGKERLPLLFKLSGGVASSRKAGAPPPVRNDPPLLDDAQELLEGCQRLSKGWHVRAASQIFDLPGLGLCVPDLVFERKAKPPIKVHVEVLGFWSREAVWRRVELVQAGLSNPMLFAVASRLRVSEAVLDDESSGALYVYKTKMNPRAVLEKVEALAARAPTTSPSSARVTPSKKRPPRAPRPAASPDDRPPEG